MNTLVLTKLLDEAKEKLENYEIPEERVETYLKEFLAGFLQHMLAEDFEHVRCKEVLEDYIVFLKRNS
jgi:hypothetical protein